MVKKIYENIKRWSLIKWMGRIVSSPFSHSTSLRFVTIILSSLAVGWLFSRCSNLPPLRNWPVSSPGISTATPQVLAIANGSPCCNLSLLWHPCCSFSVWGVLPSHLWGKSCSAVSQDSNATSRLRAYLSVLDTWTLSSPPRIGTEGDLLVEFTSWFMCLDPQRTERSLRAGALGVCIFVALVPGIVHYTRYMPLKYLLSKWVYSSVWTIDITLYCPYTWLDFWYLSLSSIILFI